MFAKAADTITKKLQENNSISNQQFEICRFGIQQGLTIILNIITVIVIGTFMRELWQAMLFLMLYAPLRSYAGGYHAQTDTRCYFYSILLMITVLLAMRYLIITNFICIIILLISLTIVITLAPVEDPNKPLDNIEQAVYKKRTLLLFVLECTLFTISMLFDLTNIVQCIIWVYITMTAMLCIGKCKNRLLFSVSSADKKKLR